MKEIVITVTNKTAAVDDSVFIVNGNSDVTARFVFDSEWDNAGIKTAVFVLSDGSAYYSILQDNVCAVPVLYNTSYVKIGVTSADVRTSTSAQVKCRPCVTDDAVAKAPVNQDMYASLCALIDSRVPQPVEADSILTADDKGNGVWVSKDTVAGGYTRQETDALLATRAYKRRINTTAGATVELTDVDDYKLNDVQSIVFVCTDNTQSNILLTTAHTGEISVSFEGIRSYIGDTITLIGNGESWEFNITNGCLSGKRWGYIY